MLRRKGGFGLWSSHNSAIGRATHPTRPGEVKRGR